MLSNHLVRSFGRIKSRKLSQHKKFLFANLLPGYEITLDDDKSSNIKASDLQFLPNNTESKEIYLEIGFGFGDFSFTKAKNNPHVNFLACETHVNGIVNLLAKLEIEPLNNIRIFRHDARLILDRLDKEILNKVYILFPDPWPKSRHCKRRLINVDFLRVVAEKMVLGGDLTIATDHQSYLNHIITESLKIDDVLEWQAKSKADWQIFPDDWTETKYQKKAEIEGRKSVILQFKKFIT